MTATSVPENMIGPKSMLLVVAWPGEDMVPPTGHSTALPALGVAPVLTSGGWVATGALVNPAMPLIWLTQPSAEELFAPRSFARSQSAAPLRAAGSVATSGRHRDGEVAAGDRAAHLGDVDGQVLPVRE
jgi:hypothetical protein